MVIYKSCMAGPYHNEMGLPCQDSFAISNTEDFYIMAVADGLGSELYSDIGSSVAAKTVVNYCYEHVSAEMSYDDIKKVMNNALVNAYKAVLERAAEDGNESDEYDTTLCLSIYDGEHLYFAQSGDSGLVALLENGEYCRITTQQRDEEGRVFPLCWGPDKWEFGFVDSPVSAFMLMTDGVFEQICPKLMKKRDVEVNVSLARRFLDRFDCTEKDVPNLEKAVYDYLEHFPRHLLDDDKTVVVLVNPERRPKEKDDTYYAIPDWKAIREEAEKKLVANNEAEYASDSSIEVNDLKDDAEMISIDIANPVCPSDSKDNLGDRNRHKKMSVTIENNKQEKSFDKSPAEESKEIISENIKKNDSWPRIMTYGLNTLVLIAILCFSLLAWLAKNIIEEHVTISVLGILVVCFLANASILLPSSSVLIVLEYSMLINPILVAFYGAFGAALGEMTGFYVGRCGQKIIRGKLLEFVENKMETHKYLIVLLFSVLPLPVFDIVGVLSGAMRMNTLKFFGMCFIGKLIKMMCYVWMAHEVLPYLR